MTRLSAAGLLLTATAIGGCAAILGFEDHEPFPSEEIGGGGTTSSGGSGGVGGSGGDDGGGGLGGSGGQGGAGVVVLLVPDTGEDSVGMYDPVDGHYLGDFVPAPGGSEPYQLITPNVAAQGPDGRIYVGDQLSDSIVCFNDDGSFHSVFADASDGLDNVRGIDFRDQELFASVSPSTAGFVARFDLGTGTRLADYVDDGSDPFDVAFLANRTMALADVEDPDNVRLYDIDGSTFVELLSVNFPQQIHVLASGNLLVAAWSEAVEIQIDGTVVRSVTVDIGRGIHLLDNGLWLVNSDAGVQVINPNSQQVVDTVRVGGGFSKIERVLLSSLPD